MKAWLCALVLASCHGPTATKPPIAATLARAPVAPSPIEPLETRVAHGSLVFHIRAAPLANLAYQLDCLAGVVACSQAVFEELWKPSWTAADDAVLDAWRAMRRRYNESMNLVEMSSSVS